MLKYLKYELLYSKLSVVAGLSLSVLLFIIIILTENQNISWFYNMLGVIIYGFMIARCPAPQKVLQFINLV